MITIDLRLESLGDLAAIKVDQVAFSVADDNVVVADVSLNDSCTITFLML